MDGQEYELSDDEGLALSRIEEGNGAIGRMAATDDMRRANSEFLSRLYEARLIAKRNKRAPPRLTHFGRDALASWRRRMQ